MIVIRKKLEEICDFLRLESKKIIFTNGCFDIIHAGHVTYLYEAKSYGDILIVGLNSDDSVRRLKGKSRPLNNQRDRAVVLSSLDMIDYVCIFDEDTPYNLIAEVKPDVLVKGGDYDKDSIVGADIVKKNGGAVITIPLLEGRSTSILIDKIKSIKDD
jgi:rfaE bifunctional protein nucleotidyltransferase chain/domain